MLEAKRTDRLINKNIKRNLIRWEDSILYKDKVGYQLLARVKLLVIKLLQNFKLIKRKNYHNKNKNLREEIKKLTLQKFLKLCK